MDQLIFASLSHTHYWHEVGMLKVPAVAIRDTESVGGCVSARGVWMFIFLCLFMRSYFYVCVPRIWGQIVSKSCVNINIIMKIYINIIEHSPSQGGGGGEVVVVFGRVSGVSKQVWACPPSVEDSVDLSD